MKKKFIGYYRPTNEEFETLWKSCHFVFDANVLLNLYGVSQETQKTFLGILESVKDRIWIPYQFAEEFHRNRSNSIMNQVNNYIDVEKALTKIHSEHFESKKNHPFISKEMEKSFKQLQDSLAESREKQENLFKDDDLLSHITKLFDSKVGENYSAQDGKKIIEEAQLRIEKKIPPGYMDKDKEPPFLYGDYLGWREIINFSKDIQKSVIFITNDSKEDWWHIRNKKILGPRAELVKEFFEQAKNQFYMYSSDSFMSHANKYLGQKIAESSIDEVKQARMERMRSLIEKASGSAYAKNWPKSAAAHSIKRTPLSKGRLTQEKGSTSVRKHSLTKKSRKDSDERGEE